MFVTHIQRNLFRVFSFLITAQMLITPSIAQAVVNRGEVAPFTVQVAYGIPDKGYIDSFHNAFLAKNADTQTQMEFSLYALRNVHVAKLLKTRKALKELIGSNDQLLALSLRHESMRVTYDVPESVKKLYLGENEILDVASDVSFLQGKSLATEHSVDLAFDPEVRHKLVTGLLSLSVNIVRYDNLLKYVKEDMWPEAFPNDVARKMLRKEYSENYKIKDIEIQLQGMRDFLVHRYHLLTQEEDKVPLYRQIYKILEKEEYGFPLSTLKQTQAKGSKVFKDRDVFELPSEFEDKAFIQMDSVLGSSKKEKLIREVNTLVEKGLLAALNSNTEALEALTKAVEFKDNENLFLFLALNEAGWSETKMSYSYLKDYINFNDGFVESFRQNDLRNLKKETIARVSIQTGIAAAVIVTILTAGSTIMAGSAVAGTATAATSVKAIGTGVGLVSGMAFLGKSVYSYAEALRYSHYATNLYNGSADISSLEEVKYYKKIESAEFSALIFSLIAVGAPTIALNLISKGQKIIVEGGRRMVMLHPETFGKMEVMLNSNKARFIQLGAFGKLLMQNSVNTLVKATGNTERLIHLEQMIQHGAKIAGVSVARAKDILAQTPQAKSMMEWYAKKIEVNPLFLSQLGREIGVDLSIMLVSEFFVRGKDQFIADLPFIIMNGFVWTFLTGVIVAKSTASTQQPKMMFDILLDKSTGVLAKGISLKDRAKAIGGGMQVFASAGKDLAVAGSVITFGVHGFGETLMHLKDPSKEEASERLKRVVSTAIFFGAYLGLSSNLRSQAINSWMEPKVVNNIGRKALAKQGFINPDAKQITDAAKASKEYYSVMGATSFANNMFGNIKFSYLLKELGLQTTTGEDTYEKDMENIFFRIDQNNNQGHYLFDFL